MEYLKSKGLVDEIYIPLWLNIKERISKQERDTGQNLHSTLIKYKDLDLKDLKYLHDRDLHSTLIKYKVHSTCCML